MITHISWQDANAIFKKELGCSIPVSIDGICDALCAHGKKPVFIKVNDYQDMNDSDTLSLILNGEEVKCDEEAIVITDYIYYGSSVIQGNASPWSVSGELHQFVDGYRDRYGEFIFDCDAIMLLRKHRRVILFRHDGFACHVLY